MATCISYRWCAKSQSTPTTCPKQQELYQKTKQGAQQRNVFGRQQLKTWSYLLSFGVLAIRGLGSCLICKCRKCYFEFVVQLKGPPPLKCQLPQFKFLNYTNLNWLRLGFSMCKLMGPQHYVPKQFPLYCCLLQLVQLFTNKQRTGVLELEAGLEAYIIPPCPLVGRLLRTARKSASMASHDASLIRSALDSCQLLLAIIHKKVCASTPIPA